MSNSHIEHIFILDDGSEDVQKLHLLLSDEGYDAKTLTKRSLTKLLNLSFRGTIICTAKHFAVANDISQSFPDAPILFIAKDEHEKNEAFKFNFNDFINTPFHIKEVCKRIENTLEVNNKKSLNRKEQQSAYSRLANTFNECFISVSENSIITDISDAFEKSFFIPKNELIGQSIETLFHEDHEYQEFQNQLTTNGKVRDFVITIQGGNNTLHWMELSATFNFDNDGVFLGGNGIIKDVTDAKLAEKDREALLEQIVQEMTKSEETTEELNNFLHAIDEHALISVTDQKGVITYVNEKFCHVTEYEEEELLGQTHHILNSGYHDRQFWENLWKTISAGDVWKGEIQNKTKKETNYWEHTTIVPFKDHNGRLEKFVCLRTDITELKLKEEEIKARELKFNTLFDSSSDTVILMQDEHFKDCNFATLQMFGIPSLKQFLQMDIARLSPKNQPNGISSKTEFKKNFDFANRNGNCRFEWLFRDVLEREFFAEVIIDKMPLQGSVSYQVVIRDMTARKQAEDQLIEAKEIAEQASREKADFLSVMSHEIRTPINAVIGITHLLMDNNPRKDQFKNLETLKFSSQNLLSLVNDILDFSKIEAGKIEFEKTEFDLNYTLKNLACTFDFRTTDNVDFIKQIDKSIPSSLIGDPNRLTQILTNLLSNAFKFTSKGNITLTVHAQSNSDEKTSIYFEVKDSGIGISEDKLEHIFQSFAQEKSDTTRKYGGTGLGLAITKKLIELQGGEIKVESKLGEGTKFFFTLEYEAGNEKTQNPDTFRKEASQIKDLSGVKLLLVEDNQFNVMVVKQFLQKWGIETTHAANGIDAFNLTKNNTYDIILMDLQMPQMDGYESTKKIRALKDEWCQEVPIIALTAEAMSEVREKVLHVGMNDYVTKPFNPPELNRKIYKYTIKKNNIKAGA